MNALPDPASSLSMGFPALELPRQVGRSNDEEDHRSAVCGDPDPLGWNVTLLVKTCARVIVVLAQFGLEFSENILCEAAKLQLS